MIETLKYPDTLPRNIAREVHMEIMRRAEAAVAADEERDALINDLSDQLAGVPRPTDTSKLGNAACTLEDPLTAEHFYDVLANVIPGWERAKLCMVDAENPDDSAEARVVEDWLNRKAAAAGIRDALYRMFYYANSGLFGVTRLVWKDEAVRRLGEDRIVYSGIRFVVPHPTDFHLYPSGSTSPENALACVERLRLTREELLDGIEDMGYDEEAVMQCIRQPAAYDPEDERQQDGADDADDRRYTCYYVIGRVPLLTDADGGLKTPKEVRERDWEWLVCPDRNVVLMCREYRYSVRPWVIANAIIDPDSYEGNSTVRLLTPLQDQATGLLRAYMNSVNIAAVPAMVMRERLARRFGHQKVFPGAHILVEHELDEMKPLVWDMRGLAAMEVAWSNIATRAAGLASAQGRPTMGADKVRKATEVAAMEQQVSAKFDLIFTCVRTAIENIFKTMLVMYATEADAVGDTDVPADTLWKPWRFTATATTETANPRLRAEQTARKNAIQNEYLTSVIQLPPEYHALKWHAAMSMLMDEGERQPELWLGPQPPPFEEAVTNSIVEEMRNGLAEGQGQPTVGGSDQAIPAGGA